MTNIVAFPQDDQRRHTVLIVDDEPAIRGFLYDYLSECGFNPLAVESADEAVKLLEKGYAVTGIVRRSAGHASPRIIAGDVELDERQMKVTLRGRGPS